jgi:Amt family ammonium transporter
VFASHAINPAVITEGAFFGGGSFLLKETVAVVATAAYAFIFTYLMLALINKITPVRVKHEDEMLGLDESLHGEKAYVGAL